MKKIDKANELQDRIKKLQEERDTAVRELSAKYRDQINKLNDEWKLLICGNYSEYVGRYYASVNQDDEVYHYYKVLSMENGSFVLETYYCGHNTFIAEGYNRLRCSDLVKYISGGKFGIEDFFEINKKDYNRISNAYDFLKNTSSSVSNKYLKKQ